MCMYLCVCLHSSETNLKMRQALNTTQEWDTPNKLSTMKIYLYYKVNVVNSISYVFTKNQNNLFLRCDSLIRRKILK